MNLPADPLERYELFRSDPWSFLCHCVLTHDEVDQDNPIKPYPGHFEYLRFLTIMWMKKKKLAIPKSRRLTVSWTFIALGLWDCIFHKGRSWAFVSKKEEDSKELVQRAKFIYDHIPENMIPRSLIPPLKRGEMQSSPPVMEFEGIYSKIMGFPSGGNQLRQRGFSGILEDECAFWDDAEAAYASAEPTIKGGGRMVMVSTRYPGFFKKIVYDKLDARDINFPDIAPVVPSSPMEGIEVWTNPANGFTVIDLSHRANPAKRDPVFEAELRRTLPKHLFDMEYGKSWQTFEGKSVEYCDDFNPAFHLTRAEPDFHVGLPLILGWDSSGLTPAVLISQLQEDRLVTFLEILGVGMGASRYCPMVAEIIRMRFPQVTDIAEQTINFFDPAGFKRSETNERTYLSYMTDAGFKQARPGPLTWERRKSAVSERLCSLSHGQSKALIYEKGCPTFVAGLKGGYRYPNSATAVEPDRIRPIKDIHSHTQDAYQYVCGGLKSYIKTNYTTDVPLPHYSFQKGEQGKPRIRSKYGNER